MKEFMLSGDLIQKAQLKANRYEKILEWIEYDRFENVEYLAKGGFGTIYKAIWKDGYIEEWDFENNKWRRSKYWAEDYENFPVVLKCLHNSQDVTVDFLREIELHTTISSDKVTFCYGITKDPESNNFMMGEKLNSLQRIANGLEDIHSQGLIHHNIHCGNILNHDGYIRITGLGLCRPANVKSSQDEYKKVYGVLPYVAPEVLRVKEYTQESDIYGFGIIAYEVYLPEPKNAVDDKDDDNSFKYSEAIDFTKLNLDKNS
ncbi:kinase-like domain-containing protein [Rhizophagus irregularis DAOM 181602=DAOM 197198]|nr:kinase-like domain-containing protein [Rhizophagus irregularis DAOM 181602=DAOM 197198]